MNSHHHALSFWIAVTVTSSSALAQSPSGRTAAAADFDAYVTRAMRNVDAPGAAVAIVKDGRVVLAKGFGVRKIGEATPIDAHTLFQIASNTKAFTTAALSILVDEGKLRWDDRVTRYLPWFELSDPYVTRELTVRDLLTHRSGLGLGAGDLLWFHSNYSRDEVLHRIRAARVASSFRSEFAYDNILYIAAGEIIPAVTGKSWDEFVRERILVPLGMSETYTGVTAVPKGSNFAYPHAIVSGKLQVVSLDSVDVTAAAGGINANVTDLAKWMMAQLDSGRVSGKPLWTTARTREMWAGQTILPIGAAPVPQLADLVPHFSEYGLGWFLRDYRGRKLMSHDGGLEGMTSKTILVPEARLGVVVLTNSETPLATEIAYRAIDDMLGTPRTEWADIYARLYRSDLASAAEVERTALGTRDSTSRPSLALAKYAGHYNDPMYGDATIGDEGGKLVLRFSHSPDFVGDMQHWQYDTFVAHWRTRNIPDAFVTFSLTPRGEIDTMKMAAVSPLADFSFDYQDLTFSPVR